MSSRFSKSDDGVAAERVTVGRILRPHGLRGEVVVEVLSDVPGRLGSGSSVKLAAVAGSAGEGRSLLVVASRAHKSGALVRFAGVDDCDAAAALRGAWLEIDESEVPAPPAGTYYQFQLVGCVCRDGGLELGRVTSLIEDGGGHLLVVADGARELLVPFVARFLTRVDVEAGIIDLELPPGLVDTCASKS
jgi:16S rRNA processing protein RimM